MTLVELGYCGFDGKLFMLRPRALNLGFAYLHSQSLWQLAQPYMVELVERVHESCSIAVLDGTSYAEKMRIKVPNGPGMTIFSPDGRYGYVCSSFTPETVVVSTQTHEIVGHVQQVSPFCPNIAATPDGAQVWMYTSNLDARRTVYVASDADVVLRHAPGKAQPKDYKSHKIVGKSIKREDVVPKVFCKEDFCTDIKVPGMVHGRVIRPAVAGAVEHLPHRPRELLHQLVDDLAHQLAGDRQHLLVHQVLGVQDGPQERLARLRPRQQVGVGDQLAEDERRVGRHGRGDLVGGQELTQPLARRRHRHHVAGEDGQSVVPVSFSAHGIARAGTGHQLFPA